eukprot:gene5757-7948_t
MKLGHLFPNIENLECYYDNCNNHALKACSLSITKLKSLTLRYSIISDFGIRSILSANQSTLTELNIMDCSHIIGNISASLFTNLQTLTLMSLDRLDISLLHLISFGWTGLVELHLSNIRCIDDEILSLILPNLSNLKCLSLSNNPLHGRGLSGLFPKSLVEFNLSSYYGFPDDGLNELISDNLSNVTKLSLSSIGRLKGESFLQHSFPKNLTYLNISYMVSLSEQGLKNMLSFNLIHLRVLKLKLVHYNNITGEDMEFLPSTLKELDLSDCCGLTEQGLSSILSQDLSNLTILNLQNIGMKNLSKKEILLPPLPQSLTSLNLSYNTRLSNNHLCQLFFNEMTNLTSLDLTERNDKLLTSECISHITHTLSNLIINY